MPLGEGRTAIDGAEFERLVAALLMEAGRGLPEFRIDQQESVRAPDGQYRIDVTVRFQQLGAQFLVLVECKDHVRPVEREDVQVLADKLRSAGAQKGMLFSTNGFQRGAVEYARSHGIALVQIVDGSATYVVRVQLPPGAAKPAPPPWAHIPRFAGQFFWIGTDDALRGALVEPGRTGPLRTFLLD